MTTQDPVKQDPVLQQFEDSNLRERTNQKNPVDEADTTRSTTPPTTKPSPDTKARVRAKLTRVHQGSAASQGFSRPGDLIADDASDKADQRPLDRRTYDQGRQVLVQYMEDYARTFNDEADLTSTTSRAYNLMERSGLDLGMFISKMEQAKAVTQERTGAITSRGSKTDSWGEQRKNKMPYFFRVLEDILGLKKPSDR